MSPLIAYTRRRDFKETVECGQLTDYASRNALVKEQGFYVQCGGIGQRMLYRVMFVLDAARMVLPQGV